MAWRFFCSKKPASFVLIFFFIPSVLAISFCVLVFLQAQKHIISLKPVQLTAHNPMKVMEVLNEDSSTLSSAGDLLLPPVNVKTAAERIAWFKEKLPEFLILKSTPKTRQFDERLKEFLGDNDSNHNNITCMGRFFMTWISPASSFGRRELLSLESVFKAHPRGCVAILSRTMDSAIGQKILEPLMAQGFRVLPIAPDLASLFNKTRAQFWLENLKAGKVDPGKISLAQNLSNLIRLVVVYKYGGVYLDADFIILKDISTLRNSIGAQSIDDQTKNWTRLNNAMLIFDKEHPLLLKFIEEFASHFNGNRWGYNGPYLVSRVVKRIANDPMFDFRVLPPMAFYPVDWIKISWLFQKPNRMARIRWAHNKLQHISTESYGVHLWNKESRRLRIEEGSVIGKLISDHCIICHDIYDS